VFNKSGEVTQYNAYYPYGMLMNQAGISTNDYLYNGKEIQPFTGYYAYGFRQYDSQIGRWHSPDKLSEWQYSVSPYSYVGGNPVMLVDIAGLIPNS
jgi:RHS repeat-associated protein